MSHLSSFLSSKAGFEMTALPTHLCVPSAGISGVYVGHTWPLCFFFFFVDLEKTELHHLKIWAGWMAQWLRSLAASAKDPRSVPSTQVEPYN